MQSEQDFMHPYLSPQNAKRLEQCTVDLLVRDGRTARRLGFSVDQCPPFRLDDMAISWRMGWRWEDEDIRKRARRK